MLASLACASRRLACRYWAGRVALRENRAPTRRSPDDQVVLSPISNPSRYCPGLAAHAALLVVWSGHEPNHWRDFRYPWPATAAGAPKTKARFADLGGTVLALSPAEYGKRIAEETEKW